MEEAGYGVGHRVLELLAFRERQYRRETKLIGVLQFVSSTVWKALFNKVADSLERSTENEDEYMIHEREPITNAFVSAPADMSQLNCAAYIAGIISGVLNGASFVRLSWAVGEGGECLYAMGTGVFVSSMPLSPARFLVRHLAPCFFIFIPSFSRGESHVGFSRQAHFFLSSL